METAQLEGLLVGQRAHPQRMRKPGLLCSRLRRQLRSVRNSYRRSLADASTGTASEWLRDNYYILHREGRHAADAIAAMRPIPCGRDGMPLLYRLIRDFLVEGRCPVEEEDLDDFLAVLGRHRDLYEQELEALPALLGAAMLDLCVQALEPGRPSEPAAGMMAYAVSGLRALDGVDFRGLIERHSPIERTLAEDPAGAYREMDEDTRALYRDTVARRALREHREEVEVARQVVRQAQMGAIPRLRHVGAYLLAGIDGRISGRGRLLLMLQALLPALLAGGFGACWRSGWAAFLAFWPLWELLRPPLEWLCSRGVPAQPLPRMAMKEGISEEQATVICVTALLPAAGEAGWIERRLEDLYRKNPDGALSFLLLADYKPARYPHMPEDEVLLAAARREIDRLNRRYGDRFMLLVRPRRWCETQRCFCGWERKRGAILELCRIIRGQQEPQGFFRGDLARLRRARYLLALDADTGLLMDGAVELVRTAAHPLNRPVIDREAGRVTAGYGILVPRIATDLRSAGKSWFARVMGGAGGVSSYALMAGNLYQDLYHQGIFTGKGLIDVEAAGQLLEGAFPENRVLSHDVLEGGILRTGYAAATEMTDAVPSSAGPWFERMHRWLRGDWQNLPFLFSPVRGHHPLPGGMVRWFLWDNLRRALTPVMQIAALAALRLLPPAAGAGLAGLVLLGVIGPRLFAMLPLLFANGFFALTRRFYSRVLPQALEGLGQAVFELVLLPKTALVALDAALRSLFRMGITRRHLLEWRTAADSERPERSLGGILQRFGPAELAGFVLFFWVPPGLGRLISLVFLALLPLAVLSARPIPARSETLPAGQREMLLRHAASMWRFLPKPFRPMTTISRPTTSRRHRWRRWRIGPHRPTSA